ncbi:MULTISPECIES: sugar ABC transporter substrate-binding protein [Metabacillus]|jgi:ribose transport system substrate-binding protein|uniref:Sugar ABC transporter substrate-binding protein n=1 Tax=Metabacillus rhizolycopersici TaxID=2875709 RepID=A0ABS7UV67_9BACI|nr:MULTISPECIES: sugar ABC transporter substrate-binding protein [Metabacillus]MBZ5751824.1 sugar ABC transporter substrate-binding protein [Metabacillus rhizolycopersici]MCM3652297.1 sugar ABC transporter substrate-binding protein [Metabacillus litoralis]
MKRKGFLSIFTLSTLILLLLTGCGQKSTGTSSESSGEDNKDNDGKPKIAVVLKSLEAEYFKLMESGAKQGFEDFDVEGTILAPSSQTQVMEQINILEDLLTKDLDALVVMPSQSEAAIPVLEKYKAKGIPVLLVDSDVEWDGKTTFIGTDNYTSGEEAGQELASYLNKGDEVAILEGVLGTPVSEDRVRGAEDALKEAGLKIAAKQTADFDRVKAVSVVENILTANSNIKGIFAANDEMALGALKAVSARNMSIPIIGIDGTSEAIQSISKGKLTATVAQQPHDMTYKGIENALKVIDGGTIDKRITSGKDMVVTKENAAEKLEEVKNLLGN